MCFTASEYAFKLSANYTVIVLKQTPDTLIVKQIG